MSKIIAIDPGIAKCGVAVADIKEKKVYEALVIRSNLLIRYVQKMQLKDDNTKILIGDGTSCKNFLKSLKSLFSEVVTTGEKNSTYRAKERYFDIFPLKGIKCFLPREVFILNKNLDALAALVILEDYCEFKFDVSEMSGTKTWLK